MQPLSPSVPLMEPPSPPASASASASARGPLWLARLALPLLLPVVVVLLWVGSDSLTMPGTTMATAASAARGGPALESLPQSQSEAARVEEQEAGTVLTEQRRQRLLAGMETMEVALAADDERRARRAAKGGGGEEGTGKKKDDLGSYFDAAAAVPAGVVYPKGAPAAGGRGNSSADSLVPPESDALFRATVEALLLATAGGEDEDEDEGDRRAPPNRTYHVVLRGASVSAGDEMVGEHGRGPLHQEQATALLNAAFAGTPIQWRLIDMAKGNTESSDSLATFNLFDPSVPFDSVRLLLWEHLVNDERNLKKPLIFERWIRTHLHWYPNADMGFIFVPGQQGFGIDLDTNGVELAPVSNTESDYRRIIEHYATPAGQPGHRCHRPRSLFLTSLGPLMERSGRRFDAFYRQPPKNPHPNLLGYEAMGDMLAFHIKGRVRAALAHVRTVLAGNTTDTTLMALRRAAGLEPEEQPAQKHVQKKGQKGNGPISLSLWLSLPSEPTDKAAAAPTTAAEGKEMDTVPWMYTPPGGDSVEWAAMTNATYMAKTVKLHQPSPNGRDLEGVTVECRRADGETTWEPGMVFALDALGGEEGGCTNLEGIGQPGVHRPGRVDSEVQVILPRCNATDRTYTLQIPFGFKRFSGPILWPPGGLALYLDGRPTARDADSSQNAPAWTFDPPLAPGARLRLCWNTTELDGEQVVLHNALSFT